MVEIKIKAKQRLPASTLVETMAAMTLLMISFGIGMMVYLNLLSSNQIERSAKAHLYLQQMMEETKTEALFYEEEKVIEGYVLLRSVEPYGAYGDAFFIEIAAKDIDGKTLHSLKEIVYVGPAKE